MTRANSRLLSTRLLGALLIARPVGAWLFTAGHATPFIIDAASFLAGAVLLVRLPTRREHVDVPASGAVRKDCRSCGVITCCASLPCASS